MCQLQEVYDTLNQKRKSVNLVHMRYAEKSFQGSWDGRQWGCLGISRRIAKKWR